MNRQILCRRLELTRDGVLREVGLSEGGGCRAVNWTDDTMNFYDIRRTLINIYGLNHMEDEIFLCDFLKRPLSLDEYTSFFEYMKENGLPRRAIHLYIGTRQS